MSKLSPGEILELTKLLQMETNNITYAMAARSLVDDREFISELNDLARTSELRLKGLQQLIQDNNIPVREVH